MCALYPQYNVMYALSCRTLLCHLYPRRDLFTPTFRLVMIDGDKKSVVNDFDKEQFLVGSCEGTVGVRVVTETRRVIFIAFCSVLNVLTNFEFEQAREVTERQFLLLLNPEDIFIWQKN